MTHESDGDIEALYDENHKLRNENHKLRTQNAALLAACKLAVHRLTVADQARTAIRAEFMTSDIQQLIDAAERKP